MNSTSTSPTLLSRVRDPADLAAWRQFDAQYGELILRYCRRVGLQHADAEDLRQTVMVRLARALREFVYSRERGRFRSFLGQIVQNEIARFWACRKAAGARVAIYEAHAGAWQRDAQPCTADWEQEWQHHHLRLALRRLRQTCEPRSLAIFERLLAGETVADVARALGMTEPAVHKVKQRIRDRLRSLVEAQIRLEDVDAQATAERTTAPSPDR